MKTLTGAALAAVVATATYGGGIDRSGQGISTLFETGELVEFTFGYVSPDVSGVVSVAPAISSGNVADSYGLFSFAYKRALNDKFDLALIVDQPFGADIDYPTGTGYPLGGSFATLRSTAVTGLARYHIADRFSVHGGLRLQTVNGTAAVNVYGYTLDAQAELGVGYSLGVAYEIPDIALRAVLTYNSKISHDVDATETGAGGGNSTFEMVTPQSVNLDFQTGIAANTLLTASVRWVDWSEFDISPSGYNTASLGNSLVAYEDDRIGYSVGVGRKFTDTWSGSATIGYEKTLGGYSSNLSPTDGYLSFALGAQYTMDNMKISGGVRYIKVGEADTRLQPGVDGNFRDNSGVAVGVKVSYTF